MVHRYFHLQSENTLNTYSYTCSVICECYQNGMKCHVTIGANAIALSDLTKGKNNDTLFNCKSSNKQCFRWNFKATWNTDVHAWINVTWMKIGESYLLTLKLKSSLINKLYSKVVIISTFVALKTFTITGFFFFYFFKFLHTLLYFSSIFLRKWNIRRFFSLLFDRKIVIVFLRS